VWLFNISNLHDVRQGAKPILVRTIEAAAAEQQHGMQPRYYDIGSNPQVQHTWSIICSFEHVTGTAAGAWITARIAGMLSC
jgi:hypothetical protein